MAKFHSKTKQHVIDKTFERFVMSSLEGVSLSVIAETIEILKSSICKHFESKDARYMKILQDALKTECKYLREHFLPTKSELPDESNLYLIQTRYESAIAIHCTDQAIIQGRARQSYC